MSSGRIELKFDGHVAHVTIDDVARHNALTLAMWESLLAAFHAIDDHSQARVCILRGAGDRAFVSGANISEFDKTRSAETAIKYYNDTVREVQQAIFRCRVPVIAAISGVCYGGGLGLALSCDLRYAAPHSRFCMPAARMGLGYDLENMRSILNSLGHQGASEAFFTARAYEAKHAERLGMVMSVVDDVFGHCQQLADEIAQNAPLTIQAAKQSLVALAENKQDLTSVISSIDACFKSTDYAEGRLAFAQKRSPQFTGQ